MASGLFLTRPRAALALALVCASALAGWAVARAERPAPPASAPAPGSLRLQAALTSQGTSTLVQFPLLPASLKTTYPAASGLVSVLRGNRDNAASDSVTVDVQHLPPNLRFTVFYTELAQKPFGNVEYVGDLTTRANGSGETVFQNITFVAFAMDSDNPGTSTDGMEGLTSGINLEHLGLWFASLQDARRALKDPTLTGTLFDAGSPPLHAGPQALTDGQADPVI